jgi:hypothetical protein
MVIKINRSPDSHFGVTLSSGVSKMGARKGIIDFATREANNGVAVMTWIVPGKVKAMRLERAKLLHGEYERQILSLRPKD